VLPGHDHSSARTSEATMPWPSTFDRVMGKMTAIEVALG